jgi:hypothetical protein
MQHRAREIIGRGIAGKRRLFDFRAAGIGQTEHFPDLVVGLARRIVAGAAEFAVAPGPAHIQQQRVAAGNDQRQMRRHRSLRSRNGESRCPSRWLMPRKGRPKRAGHRLGRGAADQQRRGQPGAAGRGERIDLRHGHAGIGQRFFDQVRAGAASGCGRQARAPPRRVRGGVRSARKFPRPALRRACRILATQDRHRGFVAGGFDRKKHGHAARRIFARSLDWGLLRSTARREELMIVDL